MNTKVIWESAKQFIKGVGKVASCAAVILVAEAGRDIISQEIPKNVSAGYGDAVKEIMNSDMFDSSKRAAIRVLRKNGDYEYYKAIISVVNSDMFDCSKVDLIQYLSE